MKTLKNAIAEPFQEDYLMKPYFWLMRANYFGKT
jgi:hypothetical protein